MAKNLKRFLSAILALLMCVSTLVPAIMAEETNSTTWYGDNVKLEYEPGTEGYNYVIFADRNQGYYYYETSNHTIMKEATGGGAVHLFAMINTNTVDGTWTPDGLYNCGESNYDVVYCCDAATGSEAGPYFKRLNPEDSTYYGTEQAEKLRAIVMNSYPYLSVDEAKAFLKAAGFTQADALDRSELISATQAAIWAVANEGSGDSYTYNRTAKSSKKLSWGGYLHDYTPEITNFSPTEGYNSWGYKTDEEIGNRINALKGFLLGLTPVKATQNEIVISNLEIVESVPVVENDELYSVILNVELNNSGSSAEDSIKLDVYVGDALYTTEDITLGVDEYTVKVNAKAGDTIKAVVSGTQNLPKSVYFYESRGGRDAAQCMIGVAEGATEIHAEDEITLVVGSVTGAVTLQKVDDKGNALAGAAFDLYTEVNGEMVFVESLKVGENGSLFIGDLQPGAYELKETKAPTGYEALEEPIRFNIADNGIIYLTVEGNAKVEIGKTSYTSETVEGEITADDKLPEIVLYLTPGEDTSAEISVSVGNETINRKASATTSEIVTNVNSSSTGTTFPIGPVYDVIDGVKEDKGGMFDYQFNSGLTSKYSDPTTWTDMPADADVRFVGTGEHSKYYVAVAYVVYDRNEDGSVKVDEDGNYIIKQLRRYEDESSPALTINGVETTELFTEIGLQPVYDNFGGSRPFMFAMKDRNGQAYYGYCCDLDTPANDGYYYTIANIEDSNYYGSDDSEAHIRSIVMNGYWGTTGIPAEDGSYAFGSLELLKQKLIAYLDANPELNTSLTAPVLDPNNKYQPMVDENGETVYATKTMKEMVEGLTSGEALLATQAAIWSYSNGCTGVLNGKDGSIVLDPDGYKWNHDAMGSSKTAGGYKNGEAMDDFASTAVDFLYTWLINLDTAEESTIVINDKNFIENIALEIGNKVADNTYLVNVSFELGFVPGENDDLSIELTYGETTITAQLTGENAIDAVNGRYVIEGLTLTENEAAQLTLRLVGKQYLEHGAYVYLAHGGRENSQNFVGVAEGEKLVDVSKTISFTFEVEETKQIEKTYTSVDETLIVVNTPIVLPPLEGEKKTSLIDRGENRYQVSIEVPGGDAELEHDEIILMVDGSYSGDEEWPAMKEAITSIGEAVLDGNGHTVLTLMAFGMGDNEVLVHVKTVEELTSALGELPGNLLRGVSSTNCEAGFTGVAEYITNHESDLEDAIVIYITDGGINTDETPRLFYNWTEYAPNVNSVINWALKGVELAEGTTQEQKIELVNQLWADVFALSGMDINAEYPISEMERAFLVYAEDSENTNGWYVYYSFLYAMKGSKFDKYPNVWSRTYNSVFELANVENVKDLYLVRYTEDGRATWMPEAAAVSADDNIHYVKSDSITTLTSALESTVSELAKTPYNDVVISDYMSKWVNLIPETVKIVDVTTGETIWSAADGWLIDEGRPTAKEVPVIVELVDRSEYPAGGSDVIGNTSGDIYKLTWYVKDGALLRSDNYRIEYEVTIDTREKDFQYGVAYPANGFTSINYNDYFGRMILVDIDVPDVDTDLTYLKIQKVDHTGKALTGAEFTLYLRGEKKITIGTYAVDENGALVIKDLAPGIYELVETKVPAGYRDPKAPIVLEVDNYGNVKLIGGANAEFKEVGTGNKTNATEDIEGSVEFGDVTVDVTPGKTNTETTTLEATVSTGDGYIKITVPTRKVTVESSDVEVSLGDIKTEILESPQSDLKFDRNDTADQTEQRKLRDLYTDNGHFTDPDAIIVTDAPAGYPFKYIGTGDYSGHYVSHIRVIFERDEAGNPIKDENGNFVIKELQHSNGTPLTYKGVPTTNINGPFDQTTGTRPLQFLLKNEEGYTVYGYCIDLETGAEKSTWYQVANLEDNDYYASEEAVNHIRNIVTNGYWGTKEGFGSLASLKTALKQAVADGDVDKEYEVNFSHRKKLEDGYELQEGETIIGSFVYWYTTETIVLTDEVIDGLTEGEALDAMQSAIWSFANGSNYALDGTDRMIVGDPYYASSALGDSRNGQNDYAGAARTKALYTYLISLDEDLSSTLIINDKTFAEKMTLTIGSSTENGIYNATLKFTIGDGLKVNEEKDNLTIVLTYTDAYGVKQTITKTLVGEGALVADENGYYSISGLTVRNGQEVDFSLNVVGAQYLEWGAYIYTAEGGIGESQTMVGVTEGMTTVDVTKSVKIKVTVEDYNDVEYETTEKVLVIENIPVRYNMHYGKPGNGDFDKDENPESGKPESGKPESGKPENNGGCDKDEKPECNKPENNGGCDKDEKPECNKPENNGGCDKDEKPECNKSENNGGCDKDEKPECNKPENNGGCNKDEKPECNKPENNGGCNKDNKSESGKSENNGCDNKGKNSFGNNCNNKSNSGKKNSGNGCSSRSSFRTCY